MSFDKKTLINWINKRIDKEHAAKNYTEIKDKLRKIYGHYTDELLLEEYETLKNNNIATQAVSPENFTLGTIALISFIMSATSIYMQNKNIIFNVDGYIILLVVAFATMFIIQYRVNQKGKELVYFNVSLEVIKEVLIDRKLIEK